ncbi:MAG TPA: hypothetical protein VIL35_05750 [Vicinamibacterales bacterium]
MAKRHEIEGATIEVGDAIYFVPTRELKAYRVPDAVAKEFQPALKVGDRPQKTPGNGSIVSVRASFGHVGLEPDRYSGPFTEEDFITVSRLH